MTAGSAVALDQTQVPTPELFAVEVDGVPAPARSVEVSGDVVVLRLQDAATTGDQVLLSFTNTDNTDNTDMQLRTAGQTPISDIPALWIRNVTPTRNRHRDSSVSQRKVPHPACSP